MNHILEISGNAIVGGVERTIHNLARGLPAHGFKVTCVSPYESAVTAMLREQGSPVYVTHMDDDPPWRSVQFLTELIRHQQIDLIHAHMPKAQVLGGLAGCLTGTPVVMTIHGMDISSWELGILRTTGAHLTVVCQAAYAQALALGIPDERLHLIPNGVDLAAFRPQRSGGNFRKSLNIPADAPLVGFVGRLSFEKGPDMFLQLAQHIHRQDPSAHFAMVGDGPMRAELAEAAAAAGLEGSLHLAGVWPDMPAVYPAFDILVQTSRVEGMPLTLLEAMASGVPVAAMNAGGVAEIVEVGTTGFLAAVGDWAGLGQAVLKLIADPALKAQFALAARRRVEQKFDLNACLARLADEFRTLLGYSLSAENLESSPAMVQKGTGGNGTRLP